MSGYFLLKKMIELYFWLYTLKKSINAFFFQHSTFEGAPGGAPAAPHSALGKVGSKGGLESQEVGNNHSIDSYVYIYIYLHLYNILYIYAYGLWATYKLGIASKNSFLSNWICRSCDF